MRWHPLFNLSSCRDQCFLLPNPDYGAEIQLEWVNLQALDLHRLHV